MAKSSLNPGNKNEGMDGDHDCVASNARLVFENINKTKRILHIHWTTMHSRENQLQTLRAIYMNDLRPKLQLQKEQPKEQERSKKKKNYIACRCMIWKAWIHVKCAWVKREENRLVISLYSVSCTDEFSLNFDLKTMISPIYTKDFSWRKNSPNLSDFEEK